MLSLRKFPIVARPGSRRKSGFCTSFFVWNGMHDLKPGLIARCSGVADVVECVNFARRNGVLLSIRGGGSRALLEKVVGRTLQRQCIRWREVCELTLLATHLRQIEPHPAQLLGHVLDQKSRSHHGRLA